MRKLSRGGLLEPHSELTFEPGLNSNLDFPEADEVFLIPKVSLILGSSVNVTLEAAPDWLGKYLEHLP